MKPRNRALSNGACSLTPVMLRLVFGCLLLAAKRSVEHRVVRAGPAHSIPARSARSGVRLCRQPVARIAEGLSVNVGGAPLLAVLHRHEPIEFNGKESLMTRAFNVIIERDSQGYYVATVPELRGCHTQAKSLDALTKRVREAIELCLEVEGRDIPSKEFVGLQRIWVES